MAKSEQKKRRHEMLKTMLFDNPFLTDEDLSESLKVSIPTVRLDRMELNISELKERIKNVAVNRHTGSKGSYAGEIAEIIPMQSAISILETTKEMLDKTSGFVLSSYIFSAAENLAYKLVEEGGFFKLANIKYKKTVSENQRLILKAELKKTREKDYIVWVFVYSNTKEVYRAKLMLDFK